MFGLSNSLSHTPYTGGFSNKYSLSFDATNDYLDCGTLNTQFRDVSAFTISMWVYQENLTTSGQNGLFGKMYNDHHRIYGYINSLGKIYFGIEDGSDASEGGRVITSSADASSADTWYHIVFVFDGTATGNANRAKIYVDGSSKSLDDTDTIPAETSDDSTYASNNFSIARFQNNTGDIFDGLIDEVGIWNVALGATAVSQIYNSGKPHNLTTPLGTGLSDYNSTNAKTNLQVYYRMGDGTEKGSGTTIYDMSANSNDGTMTNMDAATDYTKSTP